MPELIDLIIDREGVIFSQLLPSNGSISWIYLPHSVNEFESSGISH
jgi:hypothetical protein